MIPSATRRLGIATVAAIAATVLPVQSAAASGTTTLTLDGPAAQALRDEGVRIGGVKPARGGRRRIELPLKGGLAGSSTTLLHHRGAISLRSGDGREMRLAKLSLWLGKRARVSADLGDEDLDLFRVLRGGRRDIDPDSGAVDLRRLRLKLTPEAARAISRRLGLGNLEPRRFATLSASATGLIEAGTPARQQEAGKKDKEAAQQSSGCPLPSGAGPVPESPLPVATRPPGAADVTGATIDWHVRESFVRYIATGEGTSVSDGATADPPVVLPGTSVPLSYDFHFPFAGGWHDGGGTPSDPADDRAAVYFGGAVRFLYSAHGIDLTTSAPEIEIAGGGSRAIFAIAEGAGPSERQVLVNLDLSRAGAIAASGNTFTYQQVPGAIPAGTASSVFAGFYAPGTDFGCFTLTYTTA